MNDRQRTTKCFSLVEMLIVVAVIAILTSIVVAVASRGINASRVDSARNTIMLCETALEQFHEYGYNFRDSGAVQYSRLEFPPDCNGFNTGEFQSTFEAVLGLASGVVSVVGVDQADVEHAVGDERDFAGSEALYFFLSRVPEVRNTLEKIDQTLLTSRGTDSTGNITVSRTIIIGVDDRYPLLRIVDPWDMPLRYDYYNENDTDAVRMINNRRNFPLITSAGPDRFFGTDDDITNR